MWMDLIYRATLHRIEGHNTAYMVAVDGLIRTMLKSDREVVKERKKSLTLEVNYGLDEKMAIYDELLECVVDTLEDSGYLTKQFVIETFDAEISREFPGASEIE